MRGWCVARQVVAVASAALALVACRIDFVEPGGAQHPSYAVPSVGGVLSFTSGSVKHAAAAASIVPPWKIALSGYGGIHRRVLPPDPSNVGGEGAYQSVYSHVDVAPRIKVMLWEGVSPQGKTWPFVLVSVDVVGVTPDFVEALVQRMRDVYGDATIGWSNVQVSASHTHSGPAGLSNDELLQIFAGDTYSEKYLNYVIDVFEQQLKIARFNLGDLMSVTKVEGSFENLNGNRLHSMERDKRNSLLIFGTQNQKSCVNVFGMHPTFHAQKDLVLSADLAGSIERELEASLPANVCSFVQGAVGNSGHAATQEEGIAGFGKRFAATVQQGTMLSEGLSRFDFGGFPVEVSALGLNWAACDANFARYFVSLPLLSHRSRKVWLGWLRVNDMGFVFVPGEPLSDISSYFENKVLEADTTLRMVRTVGVSNGYVGYLMGDAAYSEKSLESCSALVSPGATQGMISQFLQQGP